MNKMLPTLLAVLIILSLFACSNTCSNNSGSGQGGKRDSSGEVTASDFAAWESVDYGKWGGDRELVIVTLFVIIAGSMYTLSAKKKLRKNLVR